MKRAGEGGVNKLSKLEPSSVWSACVCVLCTAYWPRCCHSGMKVFKCVEGIVIEDENGTVYPSVRLSVCLSVCLAVWLCSVCLSQPVCLPVSVLCKRAMDVAEQEPCISPLRPPPHHRLRYRRWTGMCGSTGTTFTSFSWRRLVSCRPSAREILLRCVCLRRSVHRRSGVLVSHTTTR